MHVYVSNSLDLHTHSTNFGFLYIHCPIGVISISICILKQKGKLYAYN